MAKIKYLIKQEKEQAREALIPISTYSASADLVAIHDLCAKYHSS